MMVRYEVPVFMEEGWRVREAWKGITIREKRRSNVENVCFINVLETEIQRKEAEIQELEAKKKELKRVKQKFHNEKLKPLRDRSPFGIALCSSSLIEKLSLNNFLSIAPLTSSRISNNEKIFQLLLSKWETEAIKKFLENADMKSCKVEILTDLGLKDPYLQPFRLIVDKNNSKIIKDDASKISAETCVVIAKEDKKKLISYLKKQETELIITTSSFENCLMPNRQKFKDVYYAYPRLSPEAEIFKREFEKEYGYKPSVCAFLGYDAADIAIKSIVESGPSYEGIKHYLTQNTFELITVGKMGFSTEGLPYLIGKKDEDVFEIKYVDKDGKFKALKE